MSNETEVEPEDYSRVSEWCLNKTSEMGAIEGMGSIAGVVPRDPSQPHKFFPVDEKLMKFYAKPLKGSYPEVMPAFAAVNNQVEQAGIDYRPHLLDSISGSHILVDSGSAISAWPPDPGDSESPGIHLKAVNGSKIKTFGQKQIEIRIGRKTYKFKVIKAQIENPIIGWDFIRFHRLNFMWNEFGDVTINDPKANISQALTYRSMDVDKSFAMKNLRSSNKV